jgi:transcription antitermination factor NusG
MLSIEESFEKYKENFKNQDEIIKEYSQIFRKFWDSLILNEEVNVLDDSEIDPIIRFIDVNGKGNTKNDIALAKAGIRQGQWYRAFRSIKENKKIKDIICRLFNSSNDDELIKYLNEFELLNKDFKNGLTSKKAIILNGLMCLYNPGYYVSGLSLDHRIKMAKYLCNIDVSNETFGEKIIKSNRLIIDYFKNKNIVASPRTISGFLYSIKNIWDNDSGKTGEETEEDDINSSEEQLFILEKYFEDFLVGNWETTELGKKYSLIYSEENELLSQQYKTDIGKIDLLVKEKNSNNYVVIELKRNQTSDDTVGQILRYMGWVKEKLAKNDSVKGIIIGYSNDEKIKYALKFVPDISFLLYRINFSLIEPKQNGT